MATLFTFYDINRGLPSLATTITQGFFLTGIFFGFDQVKQNVTFVFIFIRGNVEKIPKVGKVHYFLDLLLPRIIWTVLNLE